MLPKILIRLPESDGRGWRTRRIDILRKGSWLFSPDCFEGAQRRQRLYVQHCWSSRDVGTEY